MATTAAPWDSGAMSVAAKNVSASTTMLVAGVAALGSVARLVGHELGGDREDGVRERGGRLLGRLLRGRGQRPSSARVSSACW